ncbi:MAG: AAA family ATPase, partial [Phycisphaerales bacterium]|nr:AAA family ATPase [Phycisphaerales bacterium]
MCHLVQELPYGWMRDSPMKLRHIRIQNFRLLADVELALEDLTTVIVGRNN